MTLLTFPSKTALGAQDFRPRPPWLGGDLQTIRNFIVRPRHDLSPWPGRRLELPLNDGSGDRLLAVLHELPGSGQPLVVLLHGLTGCQDSFYLRGSALQFLRAGYPVLRLNLRGAGPGRPLARQGYNAGSSEDLRRALTALLECGGGLGARTAASGLMLIGFSLGGSVILKFLADALADLPVRAAASVSAPIDLKAAQSRIMEPRNRIYHAYLLSRMKAELRATPGGLSEDTARALAKVRNVLDFDQHIVAPSAGYDSAEAYYEACSAQRFLGRISIPTLLVHAADDPWIPATTYRETDWAVTPRLRLALTPGGGHVGFHDRELGGAWHDRAIAAFFKGHTEPVDRMPFPEVVSLRRT